MKKLLLTLAIASLLVSSAYAEGEKVTIFNFTRAESDMQMDRYVKQGAFGKLFHIRRPAPIDKQDVIRMNRDTLYSIGIFDLTSPVTIIKPDSGKRYQSMMIVNQDHSIFPVEYGSGRFTFTKEKYGTRYVFIAFRTFMNERDPDDVKRANALQDQLKFEQADPGSFEIPNWDEESLGKVRDAILVLASTTTSTLGWFGEKSKIDPIKHLMGTAYGWGGIPKEAAIYDNFFPEKNDGTVAYSVTVKDVPVDGFWSMTVYNAKGFLEKNDLGVYSYNNVTAKPNDDGSFTINFGGDPKQQNYLPIPKGWNCLIRMYQPRKEIINGTWKFPRPQEVK